MAELVQFYRELLNTTPCCSTQLTLLKHITVRTPPAITLQTLRFANNDCSLNPLNAD